MTAAGPLPAWIGRSETVEDAMAPFPAVAAAATFDDAAGTVAPGSPLPPLWHWFYFLDPAPQDELGADGHPARGGFLPPIALPQRMFAGAQIAFHAPLLLGRPSVRTRAIAAIAEKDGRSGRLAFVTVQHTIRQDGRVCIEESQDIVYRDAAGGAVPPEQPNPEPVLPGAWTTMITPDPVLLFRFSALTFNAHRIHYDQAYATGVESYPGLVVHGPLTAVLLANLVRRHTVRPFARFTFRGLAPVFAGAPLHLVAEPDADRVALAARDGSGRLAMRAEAVLG